METSAQYRYFTTDLLTNELLAEIPFQDVSWGRALRRAGEFSGSIPVIDATSHLDLYNSTMPGKTGLYVVRNGQCVWGGVIWSREYDPKDRTIAISGAEFISYFYHRFIWKSLVDRSSGVPVSLYARSAPVQIGSFSLAGGVATLTTRPIDLEEGSQTRPHLLTLGDDIIVIGTGEPALDGGQTVYEIPNNYTFTFLVDSDETVSFTETTLASFVKSIDNYQFVRDLIKRTAEDFAGIEVPRDEFLPGFTSTLSVIEKSRNSGVARLTVDSQHALAVGQEIVVKDVDSVFDGTHAITEIPSDRSFEYKNSGSDLAETEETGVRTLQIGAFSVVGKKVTITTSEEHQASPGDEVIVNGGRPRGSTGITAKDMDIFDETESIDEVLSPNKFVYSRQTLSNSYWYFQRDIVMRGIDYQASPEKWTVKLEVETPHNYITTGKVKVIGLTLPFDGEHEIVSLPTAKQITYEVIRSHKITRKTSRGGVVTMYTQKPHGFKIGETVEISNYGSASQKGYSGTWVIDGVPSANRFTFKKLSQSEKRVRFDKNSSTVTIVSPDTVAGLTQGMSISCDGVAQDAKIDSINSGNNTVTITKKTTGEKKSISVQCTAADDAAVLSTSNVTGIIKGMAVRGTGIQEDTVVTAVDTKNKKITISNDTTQALNNTNITFLTRAKFSLEYGDTAGTDDSPPGTASVKVVSDLPFNEIKLSRDEISTFTDTISVKGGGSVTLGPRVYAGTYGGYESNSDIDIVFSQETNAGVYLRKEAFVGSDLISVGELLEDISAGADGFEYRIDCAYDKQTGKFTRTLVLSGYDYPDDTGDSDIRSLQSLGADKFIFEYPGNIASFKIEESAENAATRMWVTGSNSNVGGENTKQPTAAATAKNLLREGWPILDAAEQVNDQTSSVSLYQQAKSYLSEAIPPIDELKVSVNGSMDPQVSEYLPGDWCSLLFDDDFVRLRLASSVEPRDDIIVRKIYAYKVSVPDAHGIPETVELELIRDVEVEEIGNQ